MLGLFWEGYWWNEYVSSKPNIAIFFFSLCTLLGILTVVDFRYLIQRSAWKGIVLLLSVFSIGSLLLARFFTTVLPRDSLCLYWCMPYIGIAIATIAVGCVLLVLASEIGDDTWKFYKQTLCIAATNSIFIHLLRPFRPTALHPILGYWGAGVIVFGITIVYFSASRHIRNAYASTVVALQYVFLMIGVGALGIIAVRAQNIEIVRMDQMLFGPSHHPSVFVFMCAIFFSAVVADCSKKISPWLSGVLIGGTYALILYGAGWLSLSPDHQYSLPSAGICIISAIIGALCAVACVQLLQKYVHR